MTWSGTETGATEIASGGATYSSGPTSSWTDGGPHHHHHTLRACSSVSVCVEAGVVPCSCDERGVSVSASGGSDGTRLCLSVGVHDGHHHHHRILLFLVHHH